MNVRRPVALVAAAALAVLALAGCAQQQPGAASQVGDATVTDRQVADGVAELQTQLSAIKGATFDQAAATQSVLTILTQNLVFDQAAAREGITITQGEIDNYLDGVIKASGGTRQSVIDNAASASQIPASQIDAIVRDNLIARELVTKIAPGVTDSNAQSKAFTDYMDKLTQQLGVQASPRFGTWKGFKLGPVPDDLSFVPADGTSSTTGGGLPVGQPVN